MIKAFLVHIELILCIVPGTFLLNTYTIHRVKKNEVNRGPHDIFTTGPYIGLLQSRPTGGLCSLISKVVYHKLVLVLSD